MRPWIALVFTDFWRKHREGLLYLICGAGTVVVSWGTYAIFVWMGIDLNISNALSWICAVVFAFILNKWIVFLSRSVEKVTLAKEISSFFAFRIVTGVIAIVCFPIFYHLGMNQILFGVDGYLAKISVSLIEIVLNYFFSKFIVFRKKKINA